MPKGVNLSGVRYRHCVVITDDVGRDSRGRKQWKCLCDCGNEFIRRASKLSGVSHCGCLSTLHRSLSRRVHGLTGTPEFKAWDSAIQRCNNQKNKDFHRYGMRGIKVCERWLDNFESFLFDMGAKPGPMFSLDRIDVNGDYSPENCRWALPRQQSSNKRNNVFIERNGRRITLFEFCGFVRSPMYQRIAYRIRSGWHISDAVFQPARI